MGNRNSRRKQRENAYTYPDNRHGDYTGSKTGGSTNRRQNQPQTPVYQQQPNGYAANPITQTTNHQNKTNSSKIY
jgi:hypothetical protein